MRLLNAKDFTKRKITLKEFNDDSTTPDYAILSHTWDDDEIKLRDLEGLTRRQLMRKKAYSKLENCCIKTLDWDLEWVWIDTCCIDQQSSAELSEAINSMYQWYRQSAVCFACLSDVSCCEDDFGPEIIDNPYQQESGPISTFYSARWFTRGWCLQELLAPRNMQFFNMNWDYIGSKRGLKTHISLATDIDAYSLFVPDLSVLSVAYRMTWAAPRKTTREEDIAYCLLGIFNINMPLLYGEGQLRAYGRLQEEIMRRTEDHSMFAWSGAGIGTDFRNDIVGFLAPHPSAFKDNKAELHELPRDVEPLSITGRGIRAQLPLVPQDDEGKNYLAVIGCRESHSSYHVPAHSSYYAIPITRLKESSDIYRRTSPDLQTVSLTEDATLSTLFLLRHSKPTHLEDKDTTQVWLSSLEMRRCFYKIKGTFPSFFWNVDRRVFAFSPADFEVHPQMAIAFTNSGGQGFVLIMEVDLKRRSCTNNLVELIQPNIQEAAKFNISKQLSSMISKSKRVHDSYGHLVLGQHSIKASVERIVVFEQELFEVRISIRRT
jgi:hypothetical protein